jgi:protein-tyrosine phosphatase
MHQISPHLLWLGSCGDLRVWRRLHDAGIHAVLQIAYEESLPEMPHDLIAFRVPLIDGAENDAAALRLAINTLTHLLEQKFATLVCCQAGLSRSPAIAAAALARLTGQTLSDSLALIKTHRPCTVHPGLLEQIRTLPAEST